MKTFKLYTMIVLAAMVCVVLAFTLPSNAAQSNKPPARIPLPDLRVTVLETSCTKQNNGSYQMKAKVRINHSYNPITNGFATKIRGTFYYKRKKQSKINSNSWVYKHKEFYFADHAAASGFSGVEEFTTEKTLPLPHIQSTPQTPLIGLTIGSSLQVRSKVDANHQVGESKENNNWSNTKNIGCN